MASRWPYLREKGGVARGQGCNLQLIPVPSDCPGQWWWNQWRASRRWLCEAGGAACVRQLVLWMQHAAGDSSQPLSLSLSLSQIILMWMAAFSACMHVHLAWWVWRTEECVKILWNYSCCRYCVGAGGQTLKSQSHFAASLLRFYQQSPTPWGDLSRNSNLSHLLQKLNLFVWVSSHCQGQVF